MGSKTVKDLIEELELLDKDLALVRDNGEPVRYINLTKTVGVFGLQDEGILIRLT